MIRFDIIRDHDVRAAGGSGDAERMLTALELAASGPQSRHRVRRS
jgi:hypothetical protein